MDTADFATFKNIIFNDQFFGLLSTKTNPCLHVEKVVKISPYNSISQQQTPNELSDTGNNKSMSGHSLRYFSSLYT